MKKLFLILLISLLSIPAAFSSPMREGFQSIRLVIDSETSQEEFQRMQQFLEDNGYSLTISNISHNAEGKIVSIKGSVDFGKTSGAFETDELIENIIVIKKSLFNKISIEIKTREK